MGCFVTAMLFCILVTCGISIPMPCLRVPSNGFVMFWKSCVWFLKAVLVLKVCEDCVIPIFCFWVFCGSAVILLLVGWLWFPLCWALIFFFFLMTKTFLIERKGIRHPQEKGRARRGREERGGREVLPPGKLAKSQH